MICSAFIEVFFWWMMYSILWSSETLRRNDYRQIFVPTENDIVYTVKFLLVLHSSFRNTNESFIFAFSNIVIIIKSIQIMCGICFSLHTGVIHLSYRYLKRILNLFHFSQHLFQLIIHHWMLVVLIFKMNMDLFH
jgi:hypothetical protein